MPNNFLRNLPSVNQLLESPQLKKMIENINHGVVAEGVRTFLDDLRTQVVDAAGEVPIPTPTEMADKIADWLSNEERPYLRRVINGTGIILHTGLGRAPLAAEALASVNEISQGYASVEISLATGDRGQRVKAVERLICELTGAEAAVVTNNNAAATMLTLSAMAAGKEVIVSRGQLIEIGGSYRLPDVMECSGAKLKEVGTTNKTHLVDYENAIDPEATGALLKVHPSNFEVVGFTKTISTKELATLAAKHDLPLIDDIGSGALLDYGQFGLQNEPVASDSIRDGADLILFSGDKLIGGPQCGIIAGKKKYVDRILNDQLMRAMRVGKMTLAALHATLSLYRDEAKARQSVPLLRMLSMPTENLKMRAEKLASLLSPVASVASCEAIEEQAMLGGGSLPAQKIPTWCISIEPNGSVDSLTAKLRTGSPAILGRVHKDRLLLDMRTVSPGEDLEVVKVFEALEA